MNPGLRVTSWNISYGVQLKLKIIQTLCKTNYVICVQELLLTSDSLPLLNVDATTITYYRAVIYRGVGRKSGGTAVPARDELMSDLFRDSDYFIAVKIQNLVIALVFLPTDYRNAGCEVLFDKACRALSTLASDCESLNLAVILAGDINCNLLDDCSSRTNILSSICLQLVPVENDQDFTYIHPLGSPSSFYFMFCSPEIKPDSKTAVITLFQTSDLPISNIFPISLMPPEPTGQAAVASGTK